MRRHAHVLGGDGVQCHLPTGRGEHVAKRKAAEITMLRLRKHADTSEGERIPVPILDDVTLRNGETVQVYTGQWKLVNPDTPGVDHEPWPFAGLSFEDDPPARTRLSTREVETGILEGWLTGEGLNRVHRPSGTPDRPWAGTHTFEQYDAFVFHTVDGDVRYRVVHQPDKYADYEQATHPDRVEAFEADDDTAVTDEIYAAGATRVDWIYEIEREDG
jgi:hypothetical protein